MSRQGLSVEVKVAYLKVVLRSLGSCPGAPCIE